MVEKALVTEVNANEITIIPLITDACLNCKQGCAKQGKPFSVTNPQNLSVIKGSIVKVGSSKLTEGLQGILSLAVPVICAASGFFAAGPIAKLFGITAGEGLKALCVLLFLFISATVIFFLSRKLKFAGKPRILEILLVTVILFASCSLDYGHTDDTESSNPEFIFKNASFNRFEEKNLVMQLKAERLEQYKTDNAMFAQNIEFSTWNKKNELQNTGKCALLDINNKDKIYYLFKEILIKNIPQNVEIQAENLKWDNDSEQLTSGLNDEVTVKRDDLQISGKAFSASGISKSFVFNETVQGVIMTKEKSSGEQTDESEEQN